MINHAQKKYENTQHSSVMIMAEADLLAEQKINGLKDERGIF